LYRHQLRIYNPFRRGEFSHTGRAEKSRPPADNNTRVQVVMGLRFRCLTHPDNIRGTALHTATKPTPLDPVEEQRFAAYLRRLPYQVKARPEAGVCPLECGTA